MISKMFYIYGFSLLLLSKVYGVYWNETDFSNVDGRNSRRIRNKFVTFDTTDTDIELAFQFNVPFVGIPTDRSANSIASFVNVNLGSAALAGAMIVFGSLTSFLWSTFIPKFYSTSDEHETPTTEEDATTNTDDATTNTDDIKPNVDDATTNTDGATTNTVDSSPRSDRGENSNFMNLFNLLEATINPTVCVQQYICSVSKTSAKKVAGGYGTSEDKIIAGIFGTPWVLDIISGSAVHDAIRFGESSGDCRKKFSTCGFGSLD